MSEHSVTEIFLRALPIAMLVLIVALTIRKLRQNPLARGGPFSANLAGLCVDDPVLEARLVAALEERRKIESVPLPIKALGIAWACAFVAMLAAGAAGVITRAELPMVYAVTCLGFAALMVFAYFQTHNPQPVRVAVLQARSTSMIIPPYWFAGAWGSAALTLAFAVQPASRVAAILVCASSLATAAIAWQLTGLPARVAGNDIEIERFIDESLRFRRAAKVLMMAILQPYAFMCLALKDATAIEMSAWALTIIVFFGFTVWMARQIRRGPSFNGAVV